MDELYLILIKSKENKEIKKKSWQALQEVETHFPVIQSQEVVPKVGYLEADTHSETF